MEGLGEIRVHKEQSEQEGKEGVVLVQMTERFTWHPQATALIL